MEKSRNVRVRSFQFAIDVVAFARVFGSRDPVLRRLAYQLVDAAGSVGANLQEAAEGQSKRDLIAKNCIALKEARESRFWLLLIAAAETSLKDRVRPLAGEAGELVAMLVAVVKTARSNPGRGKKMTPN